MIAPYIAILAISKYVTHCWACWSSGYRSWLLNQRSWVQFPHRTNNCAMNKMICLVSGCNLSVINICPRFCPRVLELSRMSFFKNKGIFKPNLIEIGEAIVPWKRNKRSSYPILKLFYRNKYVEIYFLGFLFSSPAATTIALTSVKYLNLLLLYKTIPLHCPFQLNSNKYYKN